MATIADKQDIVDPLLPVEEKHSSRTTLVVAAVIVILIVILLLLRTLAGTAANSYFNNAKQLDQETLSSALGPDSEQTTDPKQILKDAQKSLDNTQQKVGTLTNIPLGSLLNGKYKEARTLEEKVTKLFSSSEAFITETDNVVVFGTAFNTAYASVNTEQVLTSTTEKKQVLADQIKQIAAAKLTGNAKKVQTDALAEFKKIITAYDAIIKAESSNNVAAIESAQAQLVEPLRAIKNIRFNDFIKISDQLGASTESIQNQANDIQKLVSQNK